jgi:hypothetical protein
VGKEIRYLKWCRSFRGFSWWAGSDVVVFKRSVKLVVALIGLTVTRPVHLSSGDPYVPCQPVPGPVLGGVP